LELAGSSEKVRKNETWKDVSGDSKVEGVDVRCSECETVKHGEAEEARRGVGLRGGVVGGNAAGYTGVVGELSNFG